jgi:hypothetical protein
MKQNFSNLSPQIQLIFSSVPVYVSGTQNPDTETSQQVTVRQEIFLKLPKAIRWKLASFETGDKIQVIGQKYGLELLRLANITRLIREYYFSEVRFEDFPAEIEKRMAVSPFTAQEITRYIKSEIIDWDPWAEYVAKLPKMSVREMFEKKLKIADTEITSGYVELRGSDDLEDPTIKNWIQDYITHLGYGRHSQMQRTQYLFHSENGKNLSSQDREKLGIILKSFDENIPLPVDEENGEIVFEGIENRVGDAHVRPAPAENMQAAYTRPLHEEQKNAPQPAPAKQESFIKPYRPIQEPLKPTSPQPSPYQGEGVPTAPPRSIPRPQPLAQKPPLAKIPYKTTTSDPELNKYFNTPEALAIPPIKIHSMTEYNEPKIAPQSTQRPVQTMPLRQTSSPPQTERPKYKIVDPFEPRIAEPRLDGNIVDLSGEE